jgi:hypothetical protein
MADAAAHARECRMPSECCQHSPAQRERPRHASSPGLRCRRWLQPESGAMTCQRIIGARTAWGQSGAQTVSNCRGHRGHTEGAATARETLQDSGVAADEHPTWKFVPRCLVRFAQGSGRCEPRPLDQYSGQEMQLGAAELGRGS